MLSWLRALVDGTQIEQSIWSEVTLEQRCVEVRVDGCRKRRHDAVWSTIDGSVNRSEHLDSKIILSKYT